MTLAVAAGMAILGDVPPDDVSGELADTPVTVPELPVAIVPVGVEKSGWLPAAVRSVDDTVSKLVSGVSAIIVGRRGAGPLCTSA